MKRQALTISFIVIVSFLTVIFNVGESRCQGNSQKIHATFQTESLEKSPQDGIEGNLNEDKQLRFKLLVWLIENHLIKSYQKLDEEELAEKLQ